MHIKHFLFGTAVASLALGAAAANAADTAKKPMPPHAAAQVHAKAHAAAQTHAKAHKIHKHHVRKMVVVAPAPAPIVAMQAQSSIDQYLGIEAGYNYINTHAKGKLEPGPSSEKPHGAVAGLFGGINVHVNPSLVLGVEANVAASNIKGQTAIFNGDSQGDAYRTFYSEKWSIDSRLRMGYQMGPIMPYIAGGISVASIGIQFVGTTTGEHLVDFQPRITSGWNVGGGVEYAINNHLVARADYRMRNFGKSYNDAGPAAHEVEKAIALKSQALRLGLAYKF